MLVEVAIGILTLLVAGLLIWLANQLRQWWLLKRDMSMVSAWLRANTKDEPGESHRSTEAIADRTGIPKHRVVAACLAHKRVFQSKGDASLWSVWREEPESIYNRRGMLRV